MARAITEISKPSSFQGMPTNAPGARRFEPWSPEWQLAQVNPTRTNSTVPIVCTAGECRLTGNLKQTHLKGDLSGGIFSGVYASRLDFSGKDLRRTFWEDRVAPSNAERAKFVATKLAGSRLAGKFNGADFSRAVFFIAPTPSAEGAISLLEGSFDNARFDHAILISCQLIGNYRGAVFRNARMQGAHLSGDFSGADFTGAKLQGASYAPLTRFPSDFDPKKAGMKLFIEKNFI